MIGLLFDPEEGGYMFLRNVSWLSVDYTTLYTEDRILYNHRRENLIPYRIV
jgi:hypothetical protein